MEKVLVVGLEPEIHLEVKKFFENNSFAVVVSNPKKNIFNRLNEFKVVIISLSCLDVEIVEFVLKSRIGLKFFLFFILKNDDVLNKDRKLQILNADDFIVLPTKLEEILLRLEKIVKKNLLTFKILETKYLKIDLNNHELFVAGIKKRVAPKEIELLYKLAANENLLFTRKQLLCDVWGYSYFAKTRTVDVHIKRLREKLKTISNMCRIETVWGVGYIFKTLN